MDRGAYEKLSIRDSARSLKKYGSTSKHVTRNENYLKHYVSQTDTLQGIALKYNVTIEQIRRANRLWASDSLFLKEFLLIPSQDNCTSGGSTPLSSAQSTPIVSPTQTATTPGSTMSSSNNSIDDDNINDFLSKIDASIACTKEDVKKTRTNSNFASTLELDNNDRRKPAISRMKQIVNNNSSSDLYPQQPHAVVVQQGKKVKTSIQHHEKQQDQLFEL